MVRTTLEVILSRLPKLLKDRYGGNADAFWIKAYNDLLTELEATRCGPSNRIMVPVPWQSIQSNEVVRPRHISGIINLYFSTGGEISWEVAGDGAHILETVPTESEIIEKNLFVGRRQRAGRDILHLNAVVDSVLGDAVLVHGTDASGMDPYSPGDLPKAAWVVSFSPSTDFMGLGGTPAALPMEDGEYDWPIAEASDMYWRFRDVLIVEGYRAYHRVEASTDITSLPPQFDHMVETYLRFRGEVRTDQFSKNALDAGAEWQSEKRRWKIDHANIPAASKRRPVSPSLTFSSRR